MPELPEVETVVRGLRQSGLVGRRVVHVDIHWARTVSPLAPGAFRARLEGQSVAAVTRRAKFIVIALANGDRVLVHLRMTGRLHFAQPADPRDAHEHVVVGLDDGRELRFHDTRKFGRWSLVPAADPMLPALGPEPLDRAFTAAVLGGLLRRHRRMLKPLLLDQHVVAGLGNIYVDEALWAARLHPCRLSASLNPAQIAALHAAIRTVLQRGIRAQGTTLGSGATNFYSVAGRRGRNQDGLQVFRRTGAPCPRCAAAVARIVVAQRSTHLCPRCQPKPRR